MRNMAFSLTTQQMYACTKDVTRRAGWDNLKAGDVVMAVEKGMGLKRGEHVVRIGPIQVVSVRFELLRTLIDRIEYGREEVRREGFPDMTPQEFIDFFLRSHKGLIMANRIEFTHLYEARRS